VTSRSETLRALADRVAEQLPESATDVVLTGSTARGVADELPLAELKSWPPGIAGSMWYGGTLEDEKVELVWWTPEFAEERVRAIAAGEVVDHERLRSAEAIVNGFRCAARGAPCGPPGSSATQRASLRASSRT
jgi:hypothetical protein